jgi:hypothetical protein
MIGNVVISEIDALVYVVLNTTEKHVPKAKLVGTRACLTLYPRCRKNRDPYNLVQL